MDGPVASSPQSLWGCAHCAMDEQITAETGSKGLITKRNECDLQTPIVRQDKRPYLSRHGSDVLYIGMPICAPESHTVLGV